MRRDGRGRTGFNEIETKGLVVGVRTVSANYTATTVDEVILVDATGGARTVTLPPAASHAGRRYTVKKIDSSANAVTVDGDGSETIDGAATKSLPNQYDVVRLVSDGSGWHVV